jgi:hypothetical protein
MSDLIIVPTVKTPSIKLEFAGGRLAISGKSIPENSTEFYKPFFDWLDAYERSPAPVTEMEVNLEYFNTSSSKCLLDIFRRLEKISTSGKSRVLVRWMYEADDEDMLEAGEDYKALVRIPFEITSN